MVACAGKAKSCRLPVTRNQSRSHRGVQAVVERTRMVKRRSFTMAHPANRSRRTRAASTEAGHDARKTTTTRTRRQSRQIYEMDQSHDLGVEIRELHFQESSLTHSTRTHARGSSHRENQSTTGHSDQMAEHRIRPDQTRQDATSTSPLTQTRPIHREGSVASSKRTIARSRSTRSSNPPRYLERQINRRPDNGRTCTPSVLPSRSIYGNGHDSLHIPYRQAETTTEEHLTEMFRVPGKVRQASYTADGKPPKSTSDSSTSILQCGRRLRRSGLLIPRKRIQLQTTEEVLWSIRMYGHKSRPHRGGG